MGRKCVLCVCTCEGNSEGEKRGKKIGLKKKYRTLLYFRGETLKDSSHPWGSTKGKSWGRKDILS